MRNHQLLHEKSCTRRPAAGDTLYLGSSNGPNRKCAPHPLQHNGLYKMPRWPLIPAYAHNSEMDEQTLQRAIANRLTIDRLLPTRCDDSRRALFIAPSDRIFPMPGLNPRLMC